MMTRFTLPRSRGEEAVWDFATIKRFGSGNAASRSRHGMDDDLPAFAAEHELLHELANRLHSAGMYVAAVRRANGDGNMIAHVIEKAAHELASANATFGQLRERLMTITKAEATGRQAPADSRNKPPAGNGE